MQRYEGIHTYTHIEIHPEVRIQTGVFLYSVSGTIYGLHFWKKYYTDRFTHKSFGRYYQNVKQKIYD